MISPRGLPTLVNGLLDRLIRNAPVAVSAGTRMVRPMCRFGTKRLLSQSIHRHSSILIVGGGPSGLFLANLLQRYGMDFVLLEAQHEEDHFHHPQAHFLNTRTMELLRHFTPQIYERVVQAMSPVREWNQFVFGPHMTCPSPMATVQHPVHAPLAVGQNANGVLLDDGLEPTSTSNSIFDLDKTLSLSDCSVGHLAQHTFSRILYEEAISNPPQDSSIEFGTRVVKAHRESTNGHWHVTTDQGRVYTAPLVVAADGARSFWRHDHVQIGMSGQPIIQRLINVHFSLSEPPNDTTLPPAMLYTIFSPEVLSMVVRHSPTEYVMQIPYFPPYQTLEDDFSHDKVQHMVQAALGNTSSNQTPLSFHINSIRPWTMGSLVADAYAKDNVYLVGDAAHVFPPAGGFGMNTGLQDVIALAWRIYTLGVTPHRGREEMYSQERQAVARNNASLSVRNYHRVLGVMKSCYLDQRNLPILLKSLEMSARMGMPLAWQQRTFQSLFQAALWPLGALRDSPNSPYTRHVTRNLRRLLGAGEGLPLLFPNHELAFAYPTRQRPTLVDSNTSTSEWLADSVADSSTQLEEGRLFPHLVARLANTDTPPPNLAYLTTPIGDETKTITTRDLPAQLSTSHRPCPYCLLSIEFSSKNTGKHVKDVANRLQDEIPAAVIVPARLRVSNDTIQELVEDPSHNSIFTMTVDKEQWNRSNSMEANEETSILILIRPDGHIASISNDAQTLANDARFSMGQAIMDEATL